MTKMYGKPMLQGNRNRKPQISRVPTKAKSQELVYSQALKVINSY